MSLLEKCLCAAVKAGQISTVKSLLRLGVSASCLCNAPLNLACRRRHRGLVNLLLRCGADPFDLLGLWKFSWGSAVYWAARGDAKHAKYQCLAWLLERGPAPPQALQQILDALADYSADTTFSDRLGHTLIDEGVQLHGADCLLNGMHVHWVKYLMQTHQANPEARFEFGYNALERAVDWGQVDTVRELLANGADPNGVPRDHPYLVDPDNAQRPEPTWQILHLLANAPGSEWTLPAAKLAELL